MFQLICKAQGEFERAEALSTLIIFGGMYGENAGFPKEGRPQGRLGGEDSAKHSAIAVPGERRKAFDGRREQTLAFVVGNPFPAPPSPGNPAGFQKAGLLRTKKNFSCDQMPSTYRAQQVNSHSTCENCDMNRVM